MVYSKDEVVKMRVKERKNGEERGREKRRIRTKEG